MERSYQRLRRLAAAQLRGERRGHTLQATALVHELYLRLFAGGPPPAWDDRSHFLATAARQCRRIVIDHARRRNARKRGGPAAHDADADPDAQPAAAPSERLLGLDEALGELERLEPRAASVVELRYFGGLTEAEIAEALGLSVATVKRDWTFARSWLQVRLDAVP
jgi:RNA polymerase sigma factor (TIGR02999 family)